MKLKDLQKHWDAFGRINPMGAILTENSQAVPWDREWNAKAFFQTGVTEIDRVMDYTATLPVNFARERALDFGCGIGRLTQALAAHFSEVHGIDIAPSMIQAARKFNCYGERCHYHLNPASDLRLFPDDHFEFIYSNIVLQHMEPCYSRKYIQEFIRILVPGGLLVFQLPSELVKLSAAKKLIRFCVPPKLLYLYRNAKWCLIDFSRKKPRMELYGINKSEVVHLVENAQGKIEDIQVDNRDTAEEHWNHYQYSVTK
jgi:ubiquinone/menaquinone biosynthesis C-methylase UbiE